MKIDKILPENSNSVALFELSATYCQDDPEKDDMEEIKISTSENGGGWFFVIETKKWSIDNEKELINLINHFESMLPK